MADFLKIVEGKQTIKQTKPLATFAQRIIPSFSYGIPVFFYGINTSIILILTWYVN